MRLLRWLAPATAFLVLSAPAVSAPEVHEVSAGGGPFGPTWAWEPSTLEAERKDRVVFTNDTGTTHHVAFYEGPLEGETLHVSDGAQQKVKLKKPGVYRYRCDLQFHSEMVGGTCIGQCGEITVE